MIFWMLAFCEACSVVDDEVSFFLFVVPATLPLGCCAKGQESRVPHHSAGGWWMAFPYRFCCPSYAACWKSFLILGWILKVFSWIDFCRFKQVFFNGFSLGFRKSRGFKGLLYDVDWAPFNTCTVIKPNVSILPSNSSVVKTAISSLSEDPCFF